MRNVPKKIKHDYVSVLKSKVCIRNSWCPANPRHIYAVWWRMSSQMEARFENTTALYVQYMWCIVLPFTSFDYLALAVHNYIVLTRLSIQWTWCDISSFWGPIPNDAPGDHSWNGTTGGLSQGSCWSCRYYTSKHSSSFNPQKYRK